MRNKHRNKPYLFYLLSALAVVVIGGFLVLRGANQLKGATVEKTGDFRLTAENKWDPDTKKNYAKLNWEAVADLSNMGYQLYQSEDGTNWSLRSLKYGKAIKVLNIYPNTSLLKGWIDSVTVSNPEVMTDENGKPLINVTAVSYEAYNSNPSSYLKNASSDYQYDVLMFGTWDSNFSKDLNATAITETVKFVESGRGTLWGHDTLIGSRINQIKAFGPYLGLGYQQVQPDANGQASSVTWTGAEDVTIKNNGFLMKYPFELANNANFVIPYAHNIELQNIDVGTVWLEFGKPSGNWPNAVKNYIGKDGKTYRNGWYLKTNGNVGMIQTGHSNGTSTPDERKIIANTLYNLAQVSLDNFANDQTVKDDQAPLKPEKPMIRCGKDGALNVKVKAVDRGKDYQWYVEANTKNHGIKESDRVKETIISNIAGYFYEVSDSPTSNLKATVEGYKDAYGRIDKTKFDAYVAPDDGTLSYDTETTFTINASKQSGKYVHVLAVDRANNVSDVSGNPIKELTQYVDFVVERTEDEAKLVELKLDGSLDKKMKSVEIQMPKTTEIKNFAGLQLPAGWYSFENSLTADGRSFTFAMEANNQLATIETFLSSLRFTVKNNVNQSGSIRLVFHEKVYTSWTDPAGTSHYYTLIKEPVQWQTAYNKAKKMSYKGLNGYLATITSVAEHDFIYQNIAKNPGWLGGTRMLYQSGKKLNDEGVLSTNQNKDYDIGLGTASNWYWANGPEAGTVFYNTPTSSSSGPVAGVYSAWQGAEPNNRWTDGTSAEYILQFAKSGSKFWNDLYSTNVTPGWNEGYYVEFSEYGNQKETQELTDVCWEADVPQKVSLTAYDEDGTQLTGKVLLDQSLRIGQTKNVTPPDIDLYEFIKVINLDGTERPLVYDITNTYQEGQLIYGNRQVVIHIRQVIDQLNSSLVIPKKGFGSFISQNQGGQAGQVFHLDMPSFETNQGRFEPSIIKYQKDYPLLEFKLMIPMNYQLKGYVMTPTEMDHQVSESMVAFEPVDVSTTSEFWVTLYIKPVSQEKVSVYHWAYKNNGFGEIEVP